jgi:hypothetical protein
MSITRTASTPAWNKFVTFIGGLLNKTTDADLDKVHEALVKIGGDGTDTGIDAIKMAEATGDDELKGALKEVSPEMHDKIAKVVISKIRAFMPQEKVVAAPNPDPIPTASPVHAGPANVTLSLADLTPIANITDLDELIEVMVGTRPKSDKDKAQKKLENKGIRVAFDFEAKKISWIGTQEFREWVEQGGDADAEEFNDYDLLTITDALNLNRSINLFTGKLLQPNGTDEFGVAVPVSNEPAMFFAAWLFLRRKNEVLPSAPYKAKDVGDFYRSVQDAVAGKLEKSDVFNKLYRRYKREVAMEAAVIAICAAMLKYRHKKSGNVLNELLDGMPPYLRDNRANGRSQNLGSDTPLDNNSGNYPVRDKIKQY